MTENWPEPVWIHPSRWADAISKRRATALENGEIPQTFHFESYRQSLLWQSVAKCFAPKVESAYREAFSAIECDENVHLIGLGAGGGEKEFWLAETLRSQGKLSLIHI